MESKNDLSEHILASVFAILTFEVLNDGSNGIFHQFNEYPQSILEVILVKDFKHDLIVFEFVHQSYFISHHVVLLLRFRFNEFERTVQPIGSPDHAEDFCKAANADFLLVRDIILLTWIGCIKCGEVR